MRFPSIAALALAREAKKPALDQHLIETLSG